jgi:hypothetical protein
MARRWRPLLSAAEAAGKARVLLGTPPLVSGLSAISTHQAAALRSCLLSVAPLARTPPFAFLFLFVLSCWLS